MSSDVDQLAQSILTGDGAEAPAASVANWTAELRTELVQLVLPDERGRRWLRRSLLPRLSPQEAALLARRIMSFAADFASVHRDSTTAEVVQALPLSDLIDSASFFAGGNAAGSFWRRIAAEQPRAISDLALAVLGSADAPTRETTLSILLLDPYSDVQLAGPERVRVLIAALGDSAENVRGIAADLLADEDPNILEQDLDRLVADSSERVRTAAWDAAFVSDFERSRDAALELALDEHALLDARRTAVTALSAVLSTEEMAPLLEVLVAHPNQILAEDAVNLLWAYHRNPVVATAASGSPHEAVREIARRLLHPETGSPAAGGSRPGAPRDIYQEMLKGYERKDE